MTKKVVKKQVKTITPKPIEKTRREEATQILMHNIKLPQKVIQQIADEVGKVVSRKISVRRKKSKVASKIDNPVFLDTSAIIDMRTFDLAKIGALYGTFIVLEGVLLELKNIADSKDTLKKDRGRRAMDALENFKKTKGIKFLVLKEDVKKYVDDAIIEYAKKYKGRIITCDYNLAKKAKISNVLAVDLYEMTNILKTQALPGETFWIRVVQPGKGEGQGVGYLPDGTMLVVEQGKDLLGQTIQVEVSRIIQTDAGKILFSKVKPETN